MATNSLIKLTQAGQSIWIDYLSRELITGGELGRLIDEDGLSGVTSNPTIFQKAIEGSELYDRQVKELVNKGVADPREIFLALTMKDVSDAADILRPVHDRTGGNDGFVSIEVSPNLANNTEATMDEARRLFKTIGKKNVLVKVPATVQGLPAIEQLTYEGLNINVTLLFSVERYMDVMEAYIKGIERRLAEGKPVDGINSVASFFVSRVDTLVDKMLDDSIKQATSKPRADRINSLRGRAAVANSKIAYRRYREVFEGGRFAGLKDGGAHVQRLLWASTSAKDPHYSDVKYVEELIAPDTVNTMPEDTIIAFREHGTVSVAISEGIRDAEGLFKELSAIGIDMGQVTRQLEVEGVKKFSDSYFDVLKKTAEKRDRFTKSKAA